jgi:hypothetical protein
MTTPLTSDQAIVLLREQPDAYDTPDKLRALAAQVDADASGRVTVLYSGPSAKGVPSSQLIKSMLESGEDIRVIDNSEAARLLQSDEFLHSVANAYGIRPKPLIDGTYRGPAADWLYHPTQGPWADASARFADATVGEVRAIVGDADPNRVFGATEVPHMLANEKVPAIEGIPREALVARQSTHGTQAAFEMIAARSREHVGLLRVPTDVPVNYAGQLLRDERGQLRLDSREYFAATNLESNAPPIPAETRALGGSMHPPSEYARAGQLHLQELQTQRISVHSPRISAAAKGLGAAGIGLTAYDAADTLHDAARLRDQGNATAAQARIERFAVQNGGGWAGAATFAGIGAAAGVESGPGLLVTGAIGGIVGAVAGDQVGDGLTARKIHRQDDPQGNTWTFDPKHPDQGWTRTLRELDVAATAANRADMPIYSPAKTLTADAALSDRLTWQASNTAIELALGSPPQNRDPYAIKANASDTPRHGDSPWTRDPDTRQWTREVAGAFVERGLTPRHTELATPQRAAELERASQAIIAENAARTPAAMAMRFQAAYEHNGWSQYGPVPEAVTEALRHPGRVVGSDGVRYERHAQGQWTHGGMLRDSRAEGLLRQELDATYQAQQQVSAPVPTLAPVVVRPDPEVRQDALAPPQATPAEPAPPSSAAAANPWGLTVAGQYLNRYLAALERGDEAEMGKLAEAYAQTPQFKEWEAESLRQWEAEQQQQMQVPEQPGRGFSR